MLSKTELNGVKISGDTDHLVYEWDSLNTFVTEIEQKSQADIDFTKSLQLDYSSDFRTGGMKTGHSRKYLIAGDLPDSYYDDLLEVLNKAENSNKFAELAEKFTTKRSRCFDESGDELDIDRLMSGDEKHWQKTIKTNDKPVYTIYINGSSNAGEDTEDFFKVTTVTSIIANLLSRSGKNVEVKLIYQAREPSRDVDLMDNIITLKSANEPLDIKKISAHAIPALLRVYTFNLYAGIIPGDLNPTLGSPVYDVKGDFVVSIKDIKHEEDLVEVAKEKLKNGLGE